MYWLGNTYQLEGRMKRLDAGWIFLKAAKMGDPWAMYRLYSKNPYSLCTVWPCDSKWDSKAAAIWEKQSDAFNHGAEYAAFRILHTNIDNKYKYIQEVAKNGNSEAEYYSAFAYKKFSIDFLNKMKESVKNGYSKSAFYVFYTYKINHEYKKAYFYGLLGEYLGDNGNNVDPFHEHWINNFSEEEKMKIKQQVDKYIKENNIKPSKNYSEFSEEFFGIY
ncbi:hypothetical protein [Celerinatantimonas sp. MCCC 1A17872]|uniref:hypothetical protein n=1 Tax=Celerinatantimonas sp. MCCC 1A17872 TaxID=3177514 RepID=UPI0038C06DD8